VLAFGRDVLRSRGGREESPERPIDPALLELPRFVAPPSCRGGSADRWSLQPIALNPPLCSPQIPARSPRTFPPTRRATETPWCMSTPPVGALP
jgi:hypothetical protein